MRSRGLRLLTGIGLFGLLVLLTAGIVLAQGEQLGGKLLTGNQVTIPNGTVDHDVYVLGGTVLSNGTINGDLTVAGGNVTVNGTVNGDVLVAGGNVTLTGRVQGDVRIAGGDVTIVGDVSEDVAVVGGRVTVAGHVGQDLLVSVGDLTLSGTVAGSTIGNAGTYEKSGTITGSDGITVGRQGGAPVRPQSNPVLDAVRQYLAVLLVAVLALWLIPRAFAGAEAEVRAQPLPSFGWGFVGVIGYVVAIIVVAIVAILLAIVLGALGFGALLGVDLLGAFVAIAGISLVFIVVAAFLSDAIVGLALARLVAGRTGSASALTPAGMRGPWADFGLLAVGAAVVVIVTSVPVLGWIVKLVVVFLGLGALWLAWRPGRLAPPGPMPIPPPPPTLPTA